MSRSKAPDLTNSQGPLRSPPPEVATNTLPVRPASFTAAAVPISMPSQKPTMPHRSGFCFSTVCVIALALAASQSAAWLDTLRRVGAGGCRQRALHDCDLVRLALAEVDHRLGVALADLDPVGADKGGAAIVRAHVDLDDVDAFVLGALQQLGVGLHVGIMDDHYRRLFRDQRGHR